MDKKSINILIAIGFTIIILVMGIVIYKEKNNVVGNEILTSELAEKENTIKDLNSALEKEKESLNDLQKLYDDYKANNSASSSELTQLQNEINNKTNTITTLQNQLTELQTTFLVVYVADESIISAKNVKKNQNVTNAPSIPDKTGYNGSWSSDGTNITENTIIFANYVKKTYSINYILDYSRKYDVSYAFVTIEDTNYFVSKKYNAVIRFDEEVDTGNTNPFTIGDNTLELENDHIIVNDEYNIYGDYLDRYLGFTDYDNDQYYVIDVKTYKVYKGTKALLRDDLVFEFDDKHYRVGGNDFAAYYEDNTYPFEYYSLNINYTNYLVDNGKVYDEDNSEIATIANNKFSIDSIEYTLDPHYFGARNILKEGSLKPGVTLPTTYSYGDKKIILPYIRDSVNSVNNPREYVEISNPNEWNTNLMRYSEGFILLEDSYDNIYIYIDYLDCI